MSGTSTGPVETQSSMRWGCLALTTPVLGLLCAILLGAIVTLIESTSSISIGEYAWWMGGALMLVTPLVGIVLGIVAIVKGRRESASLALGVGAIALNVTWILGVFAIGVTMMTALASAHGRPLRVGGKARTARTRRGERAWDDALEPELEGLDEATRDALASAWTNDARHEHSAIAAFARLACDLLAVGAPPDLIERASRAAADETRHARACFSLASAYAGEPIGPAELPEARAPEPFRDRDALLISLLETSIVDGAIGEGMAARIATLGAESAVDPVVRDVLTTVAREEAEHAALGTDLVLWARGTLGARADHVITAALARGAIHAADADEPALDRHGRPSASAWALARREAVAALRHRLADAVTDRAARAA